MNDHSILWGRAPEALSRFKKTFTRKSAPSGRVPRRIRNPARVEARRFQLGRAALELFESKGYHATTISDIARRAGVSVGTVYQYTPDKEGLLKFVLMDIMEAYAREIPRAVAGIDDPLLALRAAIRSYCEVVAVRHRAGLLGYQEGKSLKPRHRKLMMAQELATNQLLARCIESCIEAGLFRRLNVELMTYRIIMIAHAWALKAWHLHRIISLDGYIEDNVEFLFSGALSAAGRRRYSKLRLVSPLTSKPT
jgi:AcrR family transcriptional regulator